MEGSAGAELLSSPSLPRENNPPNQDPVGRSETIKGFYTTTSDRQTTEAYAISAALSGSAGGAS